MAGGSLLSRRTVLRACGAAGVGLGLGTVAAGCASPYADLRLRIATGNPQGVYYLLGGALAEAWQGHLRLAARPEVLTTGGSVQNVGLLSSGAADVVVSQIDTADDLFAASAPDQPRSPRALARIYDDVVHVVVRADAPYRRLADLRGSRVSVGEPSSGYFSQARLLLQAAGLNSVADVLPFPLDLPHSTDALLEGRIDAFFWTGGLPTLGVAVLSMKVPIRLLDLSDVLKPVRTEFPVYSSGTVPAQSYGIPEPVSTMLVRNVLLVAAELPDDVAAALVEALFAEQSQPLLAAASAAALTIDTRSAIGTQPVPLHPGAVRYYRSTKGV